MIIDGSHNTISSCVIFMLLFNCESQQQKNNNKTVKLIKINYILKKNNPTCFYLPNSFQLNVITNNNLNKNDSL